MPAIDTHPEPIAATISSRTNAAVPTKPQVISSEHHTQSAAVSEGTRPRKSKKGLVVFAALALGGALGGGIWYVTHKGLETTEDAQIDADVVAVPTKTTGTVVKVLFTDNQTVKAGDVLAELDPELTRTRLAQAEAQREAAKASADAADADARVAEESARGNKSAAQASLQGASVGARASHDQIAEAQAQVGAVSATQKQAALDRTRTSDLFASGAVAKAQLEQAQTTYETATANLEQAKARLSELQSGVAQAQSRVQEASARLQQSSDVDAFIQQAHARARTAHAQVATAQAARDLAALELSYTKIVAPQDGVVSKKAIAVGQMISTGQSIGMLVPTQNMWVTANFKETQLTHMRVGQPVTFTVDAYGGVTLHGALESFSSATGARFALLPPDNATGNYTKVVQRIPVRIRITDQRADIALRPGMSVDLTVDTRK